MPSPIPTPLRVAARGNLAVAFVALLWSVILVLRLYAFLSSPVDVSAHVDWGFFFDELRASYGLPAGVAVVLASLAPLFQAASVGLLRRRAGGRARSVARVAIVLYVLGHGGALVTELALLRELNGHVSLFLPHCVGILVALVAVSSLTAYVLVLRRPANRAWLEEPPEPETF